MTQGLTVADCKCCCHCPGTHPLSPGCCSKSASGRRNMWGLVLCGPSKTPPPLPPTPPPPAWPLPRGLPGAPDGATKSCPGSLFRGCLCFMVVSLYLILTCYMDGLCMHNDLKQSIGDIFIKSKNSVPAWLYSSQYGSTAIVPFNPDIFGN